jgi:hypothetical protein
MTVMYCETIPDIQKRYLNKAEQIAYIEGRQDGVILAERILKRC